MYGAKQKQKGEYEQTDRGENEIPALGWNAAQKKTGGNP